MTRTRTLSKTDFISGVQCPRQLWLKKHKPEACMDVETEHTEDGDAVGALARQYFPDAVEIPLGWAGEMAEDTAFFLQEAPATICEATFLADGLSCSADIIRYDGRALDIFELKSSSSVKDVQLYDLAFQTYVIRAAGFQVRSANIMHINKDYRRDGELDIHRLLVIENKTVDMDYLAGKIAVQLEQLMPLCAEETPEPGTAIGCHCEQPYECPCKAYCRAAAGVPEEGSVFDAPGLSYAKKYTLFHQGYITLEQLNGQVQGLTARQQATINSMFMPDDGYIFVDHKRVKEFLNSLRFPLYHLDFETFNRAVPMFDQSVPYEQIPFQYSLHIQDAPSSAARHCEYLSYPGQDPRRGLAEQLCHDIPLGAQAIAYNKSFEASVCQRLAALYPDLAPNLLSIADNLADLMVPFQKKWVSSAAMHGSYSIKAVLPALCGMPAELDYHMLPGPHNGQEASATFLSMCQMTDLAEIEALRHGLLLYCGLDTTAMVCVLNKLYDFVT